MASESEGPFEKVLCHISNAEQLSQSRPPAPAAFAAGDAVKCGQQRLLVVRGRNLIGKILKIAGVGRQGARRASTLFSLLYVRISHRNIKKPNQSDKRGVQRRIILR